MVSFKKEAKHCAAGAKAVAPQCEQKCIEAQLAKGHEGSEDPGKEVKHSPSGKKLSQDEVNSRLGSFGSQGR